MNPKYVDSMRVFISEEDHCQAAFLGFFCLFVLFLTGSPYVAQVCLELAILLLLSPEC
jgi:hypothetical protein